MFAKVCTDFEATLIEVDGESNRAHSLVEYPLKVSVSALVNRLKGTSSPWLGCERPDIKGQNCTNMLWSPSYFAASCNAHR
jgi:putative transposase